MTDPSSPLRVVVGGPTGVGKSTLVNSLVGRPVSEVGVLRPTTRVPIVVHHPDDRPPTLDGLGTEPMVVSEQACPTGIVLVDTPDVDAVESDDRGTGPALLEHADVWVAVLSPTRYADRVAWDALRRATHAGVPTAVVLARATQATGPVGVSLARLMRDEGLLYAPLFVVPDGEADRGLLPREAVADVARLISVLAEHPDARAEIRDSRTALR